MPQNNLLKVLIKPVNFSSTMCHSKVVDEIANKIAFKYCPFCVEEHSHCHYFNEELTKTKYEAYYRCKKCMQTIPMYNNFGE